MEFSFCIVIYHFKLILNVFYIFFSCVRVNVVWLLRTFRTFFFFFSDLNSVFFCLHQCYHQYINQFFSWQFPLYFRFVECYLGWFRIEGRYITIFCCYAKHPIINCRHIPMPMKFHGHRFSCTAIETEVDEEREKIRCYASYNIQKWWPVALTLILVFSSSPNPSLSRMEMYVTSRHINGWSTLAVAHTSFALAAKSPTVISPPSNGSEKNSGKKNQWIHVKVKSNYKTAKQQTTEIHVEIDLLTDQPRFDGTLEEVAKRWNLILIQCNRLRHDQAHRYLFD